MARDVQHVFTIAAIAGLAAAGWTLLTAPRADPGPPTRAAGAGSAAAPGAGMAGENGQNHLVGRGTPRSLDRLKQVIGRHSHRLDGWVRLGEARSRAGQAGLASEAFKRAAEGLEPESERLADRADWYRADVWYYLGLARAGLGEREAAVAAFRRASAIQAERAERRDSATRAYNAACFLALAGDRERALDWFERAVERGYTNVSWARRDPDLDPIREDPRFRQAFEVAVERARSDRGRRHRVRP